jgi:5-methylcytosine-specific restriction endonuclease McrA
MENKIVENIEVVETIEIKVCKVCGNERNIETEYYTHNKSTCKECLIKRSTARIAANREQHNAIERKYYDSVKGRYKSLVSYHNKQKVKYPQFKAQFEAYDDLTEKELGEVIAKSGGKCLACFEDITDGNFHVDHRMPISKGGPLAKWNLQILCEKCHGKKRSKTAIYTRIFVRRESDSLNG